MVQLKTVLIYLENFKFRAEEMLHFMESFFDKTMLLLVSVTTGNNLKTLDFKTCHEMLEVYSETILRHKHGSG